MLRLQVIYASTSGHTEYVVKVVGDLLREKAPTLEVRCTRVELAKPEDLLAGDALVLASGTWNTGGIEGQLNPHMHAFVYGPAKGADLQGKKTAVIALGDERYKYTARAGEHLKIFVRAHGGELIEPILTIVNEPYGQEEKMREWADQLANSLTR